MPRQLPRVRATPRQIRDIQPKRQRLPPRSNHASDPSVDEWQHNTEDTPSNNPHQEGNFTPNNVNNKPEGITKRLIHARISNWYHNTSRGKKLKQLFWIFVLYRSLRLIYILDLDGSSSWQSYDLLSYNNKKKDGGKSLFSKGASNNVELSSLYSRSFGEYGSSSDSIVGYTSAMKITEPDYIIPRSYSSAKPDANNKDGRDGVVGWARKALRTIVGSSEKTKRFTSYYPRQQNFVDIDNNAVSNSLRVPLNPDERSI